MYDKLELRISFLPEYVNRLTPRHGGDMAGFVDVEDYDFPADCPVCFVDGERVYEDPKARKWETVRSSISSMAVGFHPEGNGFYPWPHVVIKASPAKIIQGHNVFGSEDLRPGAVQMLTYLAQAFPKIWRHLDEMGAEIRGLDTTYSASILSTYQRNYIFKVLATLHSKKVKTVVEDGYFLAHAGSDRRRQKVYDKAAELLAEYNKSLKQGRGEAAKVLGDKKLQEFAYGLLRFEGTTLYRALVDEGVPTNLFEFLKFQDWFFSVHGESVCKHLWHKCFDEIFAQLEGQTMKNVDDEKIKLQIDAHFITVKKDGRLCKRKANAIWKTYRALKTEGYLQLMRDSKHTTLRNVKFLTEIGLSRAFLKNLGPDSVANVVPIVQVITVDFTKQRPDWYREPVASYKDSRLHLKLVS